MSGVGKPFIHATVAKETAIAMHIKIPLVITGVRAFFVLRGSIAKLKGKISDIIYEFKINIVRQQLFQNNTGI
jgi:hypothetical protein